MNVVVAGRKGILEPSQNKPLGSMLFLHGKRNDRTAPLIKHISNNFPDYFRLRADFGFAKTKKVSENLKQEIAEGKEMLSFLLRRANLPAKSNIIIGKSLGSRVASLLAGNNRVKGVVLLGYPIHAKNESSSWFPHEHLRKIQCPILLVMGDKDPYCKMGMARALKKKAKKMDIVLVNNADHSFRPINKESTLKYNYDYVSEVITAWINTL